MKKTALIAAMAIVAGSGMLAGRSAIAEEMPHIAGAALNVSNLDRSEKFYTQVMGLKVGAKMNVPQGTEIIMSMDGTMKGPIVAITNFKRIKPGRQTFGRLIFNMANPAPFAKKVKDAGYKVQSAGAPDGKGPQVFFITDPDGYRIEVFQAQPPAK